MAKNNVFANGREIACKSGSGKVSAHFPDVCFTPPDKVPPTPPGVPIPYPLFSKAKDTNKGTKRVMVSNKEVMKRDSSNFKRCKGDEAAKTAKKGIISSKLTGKVFFTSWSMNVKVEKKNVVRHLDMLGSNHGSPANAAVPWPFMDSAALSKTDNPCNKSGDMQKINDKCENPPQDDFSTECCDARKCMLVQKSPNKCCYKEGKKMTPHHIIPASQFKMPKSKGGSKIPLQSKGEYSYSKAPCICVDGRSHSQGTHGEIHTKTNTLTVDHPKVKPLLSETGKSIKPEARWKVSDAVSIGASATAETTGCDKDCTEAQVKNGHANMGIEEKDDIRPTTAGTVTKPKPSSTGF